MHWFWKLLIILVSLVVVGVVGLALVIYILLPSPAKLREGVFSRAKTAAVEHEKQKAQPGSSSSAQSSPPESADETAARLKTEEAERTFMVFLDPTRPMSSTCDSLRTIKYPQNGKVSHESFAKRFKESLEGNHTDPQFESLTPILKFTLKRPKMREIIDRIREAKAQTMLEEFRTKKDFYFLIADAYEEMKSNKLAMQTIMDQSYLTMMLGRAAEAKPSIAQETAVMDYCREIEDELNQGRAPDFAAEKKAFEEFLAAQAIDPKSIGYDPAYKTDMQIQFNEHGLHFTGGWIDDIFQQLANSLPPSKK